MGNFTGRNQYPRWEPRRVVEKVRPLYVRVFGAQASGKTALVASFFGDFPKQYSSGFSSLEERSWNDGEIRFTEFPSLLLHKKFPVHIIQRDVRYQIVLLVCDLSNQKECDKSIQQFNDKFANLQEGVRKVLVGTKADLVQWTLSKKAKLLVKEFWPETIAEEIVSFFGGFEMMQNLANVHGFYAYFETSAKTSENTAELFDWMQNLEWKYVIECGMRRLLE